MRDGAYPHASEPMRTAYHAWADAAPLGTSAKSSSIMGFKALPAAAAQSQAHLFIVAPCEGFVARFL